MLQGGVVIVFGGGSSCAVYGSFFIVSFPRSFAKSRTVLLNGVSPRSFAKSRTVILSAEKNMTPGVIFFSAVRMIIQAVCRTYTVSCVGH